MNLASRKIGTELFSSTSIASLSAIKYGKVKLSELFDVVLGGKDEIEDLDDGDTPIVSTSEFFNGVTTFKKAQHTYGPNVITVATDGSTCSSFVQEFEFYAFYKVAILSPKAGKDIPLDALYYISYLLSRERWRYVYARKFGKARLNATELFVPVDVKGSPDFKTMALLVNQCRAFATIELFRAAK